MEYIVERRVIPELNLRYLWLIDPVPEWQLDTDLLNQNEVNQGIIEGSIPRAAL